MLIVGVFMLIPVIYPYSHTVNSFMPKNYTTEWNLEDDPVMFIQFSDIHLNHVVEENNEKFVQAREWSQKIKPTWTVITGDLADDFPYRNVPKYGFQQPKDWEIYNKQIENYTKDVNFFDITGNHDEFGVYSFESDHHYFMKGRNLTFDQFYVSKLTQNYYNDRTLHMVKLAPYKWPSAHPCFVFWPREDKHFLDLVESQLEDVKENDTVIFFCHYPLNLWESGKSSKGNTMKSLVSSPESPRYFISGHLHPRTTYFQHHGNGFEAVAPALKETNNFGLFSLDHDRFVYTTVDNTNPELFYVTSPVPDEFLTPNTPFSETTGYIRVRAFTEQEPSISISGDVNGNMTCRPANGPNSVGFTCSYPYQLEKGHHTITFGGSMPMRTINFRLGIESDKFTEKQYANSHWKYYIWIMAILWIILAYVVVPMPSPDFVRKHEMFLIGQLKSYSWLTTIFGSLFLFKSRIMRAPKWFKIVLVVAVLYPLCLPTTFIEIDGHVGIIFTYGFVCGGKYLYALWGQIHTLIYLGVVILPVLIATQSAMFSDPFRPVFIFDIFICLFLLAANIFVLFRNICESAGFLRAFLSPIFVFWPIALWICVAVIRFNTKQQTQISAFTSAQPLLEQAAD